MKTTALVYVRKSMVKNRRDEVSPERQLANCLAVAQAHGWRVTDDDIYQDAHGHRSGRSEEHRPQWRALKLRLTSDPDIAAVLVNSLDRSSRSPKDFFSFLDLIQQHDVQLVSVTEQFDTSTAIGKAFLAILMVIASLESDLASERTKSAIDYLKSQGIHWGCTPFGYDRDDDNVLVANDDAPAVVHCCTLFSRGSWSYGRIAQQLNAEHYSWRDRQGGSTPFTSDAVRSLLSNVLIYAGWVPMGRGKDLPINDATCTLSELVSSTGAVQGQHQPLITADLADRVLAMRHKRKVTTVRRDSHVYLLTPLLHCADCDQPLRGKVGRRTDYTYCHRSQSRKCALAEGTFDAADLEEQVLSALDLGLSPATVAEVRRLVRMRTSHRPENRTTQGRIDALEDRRVRLRELYLLGEYERDSYLALRLEIVHEIQGLEKRLSGADYPLDSVLGRLTKIVDSLAQGTRYQQKKALAMLLERVTVDERGTIQSVKFQAWARPLIADLLAVDGGRGGLMHTTCTASEGSAHAQSRG